MFWQSIFLSEVVQDSGMIITYHNSSISLSQLRFGLSHGDPRTFAAMSAPTMRPPVTVSGASAPVTMPMQVVSKSAAYPAGAPVTYYRPAAPGAVPGAPVPGAPVPGVTYPTGYVMPQGRVIQSVTAPPVTQAPVQSRIIRTSQVATPLPLGKSPPMSQTTRPNTVGGPAYSQSAYETKHEKDEQLQNLTLGTA